MFICLKLERYFKLQGLQRDRELGQPMGRVGGQVRVIETGPRLESHWGEVGT